MLPNGPECTQPSMITNAKYNAPARNKETRASIIFPCCEDYTQSPESTCSAGCFELYHASQALQFGEILLRSMCLLISDPLSKNWTANPAPTCQAYRMLVISYLSLPEVRTIWQCISQAPGLFVWKAITNHPPGGSIATSLVGFSKFRLAISAVVDWPALAAEAPRR
jgi:hypothetical protein